MKGSDYTIKIMQMNKRIDELGTWLEGAQTQLAEAKREITGCKRVVRAYERAKAQIIDAHPELLPAWDEALSQAVSESWAEEHD